MHTDSMNHQITDNHVSKLKMTKSDFIKMINGELMILYRIISKTIEISRKYG